MYFNNVAPGYFATLGTRLIRGRDFRPEDSARSTSVVIVNESLARRFFPDQDPLGRRITIGRSDRRRDLEIVGLVPTRSTRRCRSRRGASLTSLSRSRVMRRTSLSSSALPALYRRLPTASPTNCGPSMPVCRSGSRASTTASANRWSRARDGVDRDSARVGRVGVGVRGALWPAGVCGLATGEGDRPAPGSGCDTGRVAAAGAARLRHDCRHRHCHRRGNVAGAWTYVRSLLFRSARQNLLSLSIAAGVMLVLAAAAGALPARRAAAIDPSAALRD